MKIQTNNADHDEIDLQALQKSEARFRSIVLWSPDAIVVTDAKGRIQYMNPAAEEVFNRKLERFTGEDFGLPLVNGESTEIDIFRPGKDPGVGDMHVIEAEWLDEKAHLITIRDITKRKKMESQWEAALEEISKLNENLERSVKERTAELRKTIGQLEELNRVFVNRELRMVELKEQIAGLEKSKT